ncbi:MAG: nuclear transport factor 2 family protein [bacterium]
MRFNNVRVCVTSLALGATLSGCQGSGSTEPNLKVETAVLAVMNEYYRAYADHDLEAVMSLFSTGSGVVCYGTGADEKCVGLDSLKKLIQRDFKQSETVKITMPWISVSSAGNVAWLAADCHVKATTKDGEVSIDSRLTGVFVKKDDKWLISQMHLSVPFSSQEPGHSFPTKE